MLLITSLNGPIKLVSNFLRKKTVSMHVCRVRGCNKMSPQLTLNNTELKHVENYKYLGMFIDSFTFRKHIQYLKASCSRGINLLKLLSNTTWGADRNSLIRLYSASEAQTGLWMRSLRFSMHNIAELVATGPKFCD